MKKSHLLFSAAALCFMFCSGSPVNTEGDNKPSLDPDITIISKSLITWYRDSLLESMLYPSNISCKPDFPCGIVTTSSWDYTCTVFPDTFWGVIENDYAPTDTVYCHSDTCWVLNDTTFYPMGSYLNRQANALCSESAKAYTGYGLCYEISPAEDTVRIWNTCFDTSFTGNSFCLPKLPLDSESGVWFASVDTFFCPASLINSYDDYLTRQDIINYTP